MNRIIAIIVATTVAAAAAMQAKTLVVYYSFTNNVRTVVGDLRTQLGDAEVVEVVPAEEGLDYAANNYAIGSALISAIRNNPDDASSYPAIKDLTVDFSRYDDIVIATPLWWGNMAAPMQTFLFNNGSRMANKKIGLIVSSASSGISSVVADAKRLMPNGDFCDNLWIRSAQTSNCHSMLADWLAKTGIGSNSGVQANTADKNAQIAVVEGDLIVEGDFSGISIFDTAGKAVVTSTDRTVSLEELPPSIYVAHVSRGNAVDVYKFIVK